MFSVLAVWCAKRRWGNKNHGKPKCIACCMDLGVLFVILQAGFSIYRVHVEEVH